MKPVVLIVTHQRKEITAINISTLKKQTVVPEIVVVSSSFDEQEYYRSLGVHSYTWPNSPLGAKHQFGVEQCRLFNPSHLVITGSDDILCKDFIEKYCNERFTGIKRWYVWNKKVLYKLEYLATQPLGGGRVYSKELLDEVNWEIFDASKNKLLDDMGWEIAKEGKIIYEPEILAVKGDWSVMNPVNIHHRNVKLIWTNSGEKAFLIMKDKFNYES